MKALTTTLLVTMMTAGFLSCRKDISKGPVTTETRSLQNFSGIDLRINGTVYYSNDTATQLEIIAKQGALPYIETVVINDKLVIRYKNGKNYDSDHSIRINVSAPELSSFELNSSGSIHCSNEIHPPQLYLKTSASGNISLQQVITGNIEAKTSSSGNITATGGIATNEILNSSGSGKIDLLGITATKATVRTGGSGSIRVNASDELDATIDGSGSIYFIGYPYLFTHISGTGKLVRL